MIDQLDDTAWRYFMKSAIEQLDNIVDIQCLDGNWNYDAYMHGLANGLILAQAIMKDKTPEYLTAPDEWLGDKPRDMTPPVAECRNCKGTGECPVCNADGGKCSWCDEGACPDCDATGIIG